MDNILYCYYDTKLIKEIPFSKILTIEALLACIRVYYEDSLGLDDVYTVDCTRITTKKE